jgi:hypothetical protein
MLDPYYRTFTGLATLIEKEWMAFGHRFRDRLGHGLDFSVSSEERSPVFLQFLDAVFQLTHQFPTSFEYSQQLLVFLADHSTSCLFGNFIGNSFKQRHLELNTRATSKSIWNTILTNKERFTNASYRPYDRPVWPSTSLKKIVFWDRYFLRFDPTCHPSNVGTEEWVDFWDDQP